eukprot:gene4661-9247_t
MWTLRRINLIVKPNYFKLRKFSTPSLVIINECQKLRESIQSLNDKVRGPLEKATQKNTILPFVFLLGNHSSGKSSFINYLLQRKVQTAGVAPTDDSFTIIVPGAADLDRDGPAFIGDPDMGFSGLRNFGPTLMHHTQLKVRSDTIIKDFMLVDSPGMIDSPTSRNQFGVGNKVMDRGYDFEAVVKWYANRADVILLFFDPDKPGTTGETLSILTNSLVGMEYKLHIILNKADQFRKIHDFARAYGSLCWNLSKVIQRKDLPRIYTMCLPTEYRTRAAGDRGADSDGGGEEAASLGQGLLDLQTSREDVVQEVLNAPKRRIDNEITRLNDSLQLLQMHCQILDTIILSYRKLLWKSRFITAGTSISTATLFGGAVSLGLPMELLAAVGSLGALGNAGLWLWFRNILQHEAHDLISETRLENTFNRAYARRIAEKDEYITALWIRVKDHIRMGVNEVDLPNLTRLRATEIAELERILELDVPNLRRKVAPLLTSFTDV